MPKIPYTLRWESKERLEEPFQRALIEQLQWLNANLWEVRTNLAIMSNRLNEAKEGRTQR